jgi:Zn finger protein HypA/HybF involved in hydrogenase expression
MGIALEVYKTCRKTLQAHGGGRLKRVRLAVGELSAVEPELLEYAWEAVVADGPDEGVELAIEWCPANQWCSVCGMPLAVSGGDELDILDLSFETDDGDCGSGSATAVGAEPA